MPTINVPVAASSDDATQIGSTVTLTDNALGSLLDATNKWAGLRFLNVAIPQGAVINSASISVVPFNSGADEPLVTIFGEDADDPGTFTVTSDNISGRTRTSASVGWDDSDLGATGSSRHDSPDLSTIIQEIVDRPGWESGNALVIIIQGGNDANRDLGPWSFDSGNGAAELDVDYTLPVINLAASVSTASSVAGALAVEKPLAAEANSTSAASGALAVNKPLAASPASLSTVAGALGLTRGLAAAPSTQSVVEAILVTSEVLLAASAATASTVAAAMRADYLLGASPSTASTVAGDMAVLYTLAAQVAAQSNVSADMVLEMILAASATTTSIVTAVMIGGRVYRLAFPGKVSGLIRPTAGRASGLTNPQSGRASGLIVPAPGTIRLR